MTELPLLVLQVYCAVDLIPFIIYNQYVSHNSKSHGALQQTTVSNDVRTGCSMSSVGVLLPVRLLKSPQITVMSYGQAALITSSTNYVAIFSDIFRFFIDVYGGMYIFIMLIRVLFGNISFSSIPYSLLYCVSIYNGLRI